MSFSEFSALAVSEESEAKARVTDAALKLFSAQGFPNVSVRDIMNACGLTAGALYAHYKSKEELLFKLIMNGHLRLQSRLEAMYHLPGTPPVRLARLCFVQSLFQLHNLELARVSTSEFRYLPDAFKQELNVVRTKMTTYFDDTLQQGVDKGVFNIPRFAPVRMAIFASANTAPQWFEPGGPMSAEEVAKTHADTTLRIVMTTNAGANRIQALVLDSLIELQGGWEAVLAKLDKGEAASAEAGKPADGQG